MVKHEQGTVGSAAYVEQQAKAVTAVTETVTRIATMTPAQVEVVKNTGVNFSMGGCTTFSPELTRTMAVNNVVPYNVGFTWNGMTFAINIPAGANMAEFMNPDGSVPMWKLVQRYGIAAVVPGAK